MVELLKQPQYKPYDVEDQVVSIYAGTKGYFDGVPVEDVTTVEQDLIRFMRDEKSEVIAAMNGGLAWGETVTGPLDAALKEFFDRDKTSREKPALTTAGASGAATASPAAATTAA